MNDYRDILISLAWRLGLAAPVFALGWFLLASAEGGWAASPRLLVGMACIVVTAIILAPGLARLVAEPSGSLFYPGKRLGRPAPMYSIPQSKRKKGLCDEAMAGYEKIAAEYPGETKPYVEMIDIAIVDLRNPELAETIFRRGVSAAEKEEDRAALSKMYEAIRSRLKSPA